eukprot:11524756-Heterocapsa_arctica.AAC.1
MKLVLKDACSRGCSAERLVNGTDSRVTLGAVAKGRSSSSQINNRLRSCLGYMILGQKHMVQFWIPSKENPSDDPSRHVPLRQPEAVRPDRAWLLKPERTPHRTSNKKQCAKDKLCREWFAGCGGLTRALGRAGLRIAEPMEAFPKK